MHFFQALLHGIAIGFGIILGIVFTVATIILIVVKASKKKKKKKDYDMGKLLRAFQKYHDQQMDEENFLIITELVHIIEGLKNGEIIDEVENYNIKKKSELILRDDGDDQIFNIVERYTILGRKY